MLKVALCPPPPEIIPKFPIAHGLSFSMSIDNFTWHFFRKRKKKYLGKHCLAMFRSSCKSTHELIYSYHFSACLPHLELYFPALLLPKIEFHKINDGLFENNSVSLMNTLMYFVEEDSS